MVRFIISQFIRILHRTQAVAPSSERFVVFIGIHNLLSWVNGET